MNVIAISIEFCVACFTSGHDHCTKIVLSMLFISEPEINMNERLVFEIDIKGLTIVNLKANTFKSKEAKLDSNNCCNGRQRKPFIKIDAITDIV